MVTMAQRIEELRTRRGLSRPELSAALGLPKNAAEKFETGRQTPTQEQQNKLASFFSVSLFYLRGESSDPTRQDSWMDGADVEDDVPASAPVRSKRPAAPAPAGKSSPEGGSMLEPLLRTRAFQDALRATVLDVLRSPDGQAILERVVKHQLQQKG